MELFVVMLFLRFDVWLHTFFEGPVRAPVSCCQRTAVQGVFFSPRGMG